MSLIRSGARSRSSQRASSRSIGTFSLLLVTLAGVLATVEPAHAAPVQWNCAFGVPTTGYHATFFFISLPGPGNDSLILEGRGSCAPSLSFSFGRRLYTASIQGSGRDFPSFDTLHFGLCDKDDAGPNPLNAAALNVAFDVTIRIEGHEVQERGVAISSSRQSVGPFLLPGFVDPFPGPTPHQGVVFVGNGAADGAISLATRIAGQCPPQGTDRSTVLRMSFHAKP